MHGNRVAGESVDCEDIEILARLPFEGQARVAHQYRLIRRAVADESEETAGDAAYQRVDFINAKHIVRTAVAGQHSRAESNHANANRPGLLRCFNREAYARSKSIVSSWRVPASRVQYLLAVNNLAVNQCAHRCVGVREIILHAKRSVEVAHGKPVLRAIYRFPIYQVSGERQNDGKRDDGLPQSPEPPEGW